MRGDPATASDDTPRRFRRWWARAAGAAVLLLALAVTGVVALYLRSGPDFVAGALTRYLGRYVEIDALELRPRELFEVELRGVRVYEGDAPEGPPLLDVPRALGKQSWPLLFVGRFVPGEWEIETPTVRTRASGGTRGGRLALPSLPSVTLHVKGGTLIVERATAPPIRVTDIALETETARLGSRLEGKATGNVAIGPRALGPLDVTLTGSSGDLELAGELNGLDLSALPELAAYDTKGAARGKVTLRVRPDALQGTVDLRVTGFSLLPPEFRRAIEPRVLRALGDWSWDGNELVLSPQLLKADDLELSGQVRVTSGVDGRIVAGLDLAEFTPGVSALGRVQPLSLLGLRHATWERTDRRIDAGRVLDGRLELDVRRDELGEAFGFRRRLEPGELLIAARVEGGVFRTSDTDSRPLANMSGVLRIEGNRLEVRALRMMRDGKELPRIDIVVEGMHRLVRLPQDERSQPAGPGTSLPGLGPAVRALRGREGGEDPLGLRFRDAQIGYPAFLLPIRGATGTLEFPDGKLRVQADECVVGGAPASLEALWDPAAQMVDVKIAYGDGEAPPRRDPGPDWLSGRFERDAVDLGAWHLEDVTGRISARGARVRLRELDADFLGGRARGWGELSLADPTGAPYEFLAGVRGADAAQIAEPLSRPEGSITGRLSGEGRFRGRLEPGSSFLEHGEVGLAVLSEKGQLSKLPVLVALLRVPSFSGIRGLFGAQLPYDVVSADVTIRNGVLRTENLALEGPELRAHVRGDVDLRKDDKPTDLVVAFLLLQTVDRVLEQVPVLGEFVLGEDQSLVALYLQVDGPFDEPRVRPLAPSAVQVAAGWAGNVVASGAEQIRRLLGGRKKGADDGQGPGQSR